MQENMQTRLAAQAAAARTHGKGSRKGEHGKPIGLAPRAGGRSPGTERNGAERERPPDTGVATGGGVAAGGNHGDSSGEGGLRERLRRIERLREHVTWHLRDKKRGGGTP